MCVSIYFTNHFQVALLEFIIKGLGKFNSDLKEVLCLPCHVKLNKQEFGFLVKFEKHGSRRYRVINKSSRAKARTTTTKMFQKERPIIKRTEGDYNKQKQFREEKKNNFCFFFFFSFRFFKSLHMCSRHFIDYPQGFLSVGKKVI